MGNPHVYEKQAVELIPALFAGVPEDIMLRVLLHEPGLLVYWKAVDEVDVAFYIAKMKKAVVVRQEPKDDTEWLDLLTPPFEMPLSSFGGLIAMADFFDIGLLNQTYRGNYLWERRPRPTKEPIEMVRIVRGNTYYRRAFYYCPYCGWVTYARGDEHLNLDCTRNLGKDHKGQVVPCPAPDGTNMVRISEKDFVSAMRPFVEAHRG